jgi:DNA-binding LacI/PurR family transcriptional regulator
MLQVAEAAGVSKATVSRVLNQQGNVHPDTVRRVRMALDTVGYRQAYPRQGRRPNQLTQPAVALSAFALLIPEVLDGLYVSLHEGFGAAASQEYHQILVCNTHNDPYKQADQILQLMQKHVAAVAIVTVTAAPTPPHHVEMLQKAGIPVVLLHREVKGCRAPLIMLPLEQIGFMAGRALVDSGHKRIAIFPASETESGHLHLAGLQKALGESGLHVSPPINRPGMSFSTITAEVRSEIRASLEQMWRLPPDRRPTAIFATFDSVAESLYLALLSMGVRVPQDISLVSFGGSRRSGALTSRLSAVVVDEAQAGRRAVELFGEMRGRMRPVENDHREVMPIDFVAAETLAAPPA